MKPFLRERQSPHGRERIRAIFTKPVKTDWKSAQFVKFMGNCSVNPVSGHGPCYVCGRQNPHEGGESALGGFGD